MRRRSTGRLILSIHFAFVASAAAFGQTAQSVDIAGDWILALERYGQTDYQRMKITVVDGRVKVDTGGFPVEGELRNGRLDLRRAGDGSPVTMTGMVTDPSMSGEMAQGDVVGTWKATPERRPQSAPTMHTFEPGTFRAQRGFGDARLEAFARNVLADVELRSGDTKASCAILNATLDLELRRKIGDRFGEAESLFTQAPLARAEGRDADVVGLLGDARRRRVEIGDRPGIAECNAELARLPQRPVPA